VEQTGEYRITASREQVWAALSDRDLIQRSIENCESLEPTGDKAYRAVVKAKAGLMTLTITADAVLEAVEPPASCTVTINASVGAMGSATGSAKLSLTEDGAETVVAYTAKGEVQGAMAQAGDAMLDGAARRLTTSVFEAVARSISAAPEETLEPTEVAAAAPRRLGLLWAALGGLIIAGLLAWRLLGAH